MGDNGVLNFIRQVENNPETVATIYNGANENPVALLQWFSNLKNSIKDFGAHEEFMLAAIKFKWCDIEQVNNAYIQFLGSFLACFPQYIEEVYSFLITQNFFQDYEKYGIPTVNVIAEIVRVFPNSLLDLAKKCTDHVLIIEVNTIEEHVNWVKNIMYLERSVNGISAILTEFVLWEILKIDSLINMNTIKAYSTEVQKKENDQYKMFMNKRLIEIGSPSIYSLNGSNSNLYETAGENCSHDSDNLSNSSNGSFYQSEIETSMPNLISTCGNQSSNDNNNSKVMLYGSSSSNNFECSLSSESDSVVGNYINNNSNGLNTSSVINANQSVGLNTISNNYGVNSYSTSGSCFQFTTGFESKPISSGNSFNINGICQTSYSNSPILNGFTPLTNNQLNTKTYFTNSMPNLTINSCTSIKTLQMKEIQKEWNKILPSIREQIHNEIIQNPDQTLQSTLKIVKLQDKMISAFMNALEIKKTEEISYLLSKIKDNGSLDSNLINDLNQIGADLKSKSANCVSPSGSNSVFKNDFKQNRVSFSSYVNNIVLPFFFKTIIKADDSKMIQYPIFYACALSSTKSYNFVLNSNIINCNSSNPRLSELLQQTSGNQKQNKEITCSEKFISNLFNLAFLENDQINIFDAVKTARFLCSFIIQGLIFVEPSVIYDTIKVLLNYFKYLISLTDFNILMKDFAQAVRSILVTNNYLELAKIRYLQCVRIVMAAEFIIVLLNYLYFNGNKMAADIATTFTSDIRSILFTENMTELVSGSESFINLTMLTQQQQQQQLTQQQVHNQDQDLSTPMIVSYLPKKLVKEFLKGPCVKYSILMNREISKISKIMKTRQSTYTLPKQYLINITESQFNFTRDKWMLESTFSSCPSLKLYIHK